MQAREAREIASANRRQQAEADRAAVASVAADSLAQALSSADELIVQPPSWAVSAERSHRLYFFGGFLACGTCGGLASVSIGRSKLSKPCTGRLTAERKGDLARLARQKLPRGCYKEWPDGGRDVDTGARMKRVICLSV